MTQKVANLELLDAPDCVRGPRSTILDIDRGH